MLSRAVFLMSLAGFAGGANLRSTDPLLDLIASDFAVTPGVAAIAVTAFGMGYGVFQIVHGPLGDRYGKARMIFIMCAASALASLASAFAGSFPWLVAARLLTGITSGAVVPLTMAWIGDAIPYERRQAALAQMLIGSWIGTGAGSVLSGTLGDRFGWHAVYLALTFLFAASAIAMAIELRSNSALRGKVSESTSLAEAFARLGIALRRPLVRAVCATALGEGIFLMSPSFFAPLHLQKEFGSSATASGWLGVCMAIGAFTFSTLARGLVPRLGERGLIRFGGLLSAAIYFGFWAAPAGAVIFVLVALLGLGNFMMHNTLQTISTQMAPEARGASVSLFAAALFVGQAIGSAMWGAVVDGLGTGAVFLGGSGGMVLLAILASAYFTGFRERQGRPARLAI